ncbi:MAG: hypothetical protein Kow0077_26850 [Anaerolineae bacterium]
MPDAQVQLVYQDWNTEWFPAMAQDMIARFQAEQDNVRVFYTPDPDNFVAQMLLNLQAGTAPDVFQGCCAYFPAWAQQGHLLDLRPYVARDLDQATIQDWDPAQYRAFFLPDGKQYGLPKYHGALALYYNKDLFDAYGVPYPTSAWDHDDYLEAMRLLTHDRDGDGKTDLWGSMLDITWDRIQIHVNAWGGHFVDPDNPARCLMAEPPALEALEWLRARMWDDRVMATPLDVQNMSTRQAFSTGQVAMVEDGSWALRDILSTADFQIGVVPMPAGPVRRVTLATTDGFGIYARTRHPDLAWELLKFLISEDYGRAMARANFLQPARASLLPDWMAFIRQEYPIRTEGLALEAFADGQLNGYSVTTEVFANMNAATGLAQAAWDRIFVLGEAPVSMMRTVSRDIEAAQQAAQEQSRAF